MTDISWLLEASLGHREVRHPALHVDNIYGIFQACAAGVGIASLPVYMAGMTSGLVPILPKHGEPEYQSYFVYPEEMRNSPRICALRDFLLRRIREDKR